ncbi:MAG TPA: hypothetical protein VIF64_08220 [Pyrinomonadaceae bacterium]
MQEPVNLYQVVILSVLLSCVAAWAIAHRYRRRIQQLMRAPRAGDPRNSKARADEATADCPTAAPVSLADNRTAGIRLTMLLIASSCLLAGTSACIYCVLKFPGDPLLPWRVIPIALLHLWPVVPALALMWRWSRKRLLGALLLWCAATFIVLFVIGLWRQIEMGPLLLLLLMASEIGLSLALLSLVFLGNATRAIAPWLVMPAAVLAWSSLAGLQAMMSIGERQSPFLMYLIQLLDPLLGWLPWYALLVLFVLLPWALVWWPARVLGRALGRAYSRKWLSDLLVVFTGIWIFALTDRAVMIVDQAGAAALAMYLPLLWIPTVMLLGDRWRPRRERPPTLLVLRVFQQDAQTQSLYDHVVERWRLSGNTVMIAGTDLADRTLDADDIFRFLDRKLAERFIVSPSDVPRRIAELDMTADIDGRYRVNKCYCHDTTWQDALQALVRCSDVVLMDLRGFQAHNAGCRYELTTLARESHDLRVVVLTDGRTDRTAAEEAVASGRQERFTWIEASHFNASKRRQVLMCLFA